MKSSGWHKLATILKFPVLRINIWNCIAYIKYRVIANNIYNEPKLIEKIIAKTVVSEPNSHKNTNVSVDFLVTW